MIAGETKLQSIFRRVHSWCCSTDTSGSHPKMSHSAAFTRRMESSSAADHGSPVPSFSHSMPIRYRRAFVPS